jgi:hypothetical protein
MYETMRDEKYQEARKKYGGSSLFKIFFCNISANKIYPV